jgi:hypothetical protein
MTASHDGVRFGAMTASVLQSWCVTTTPSCGDHAGIAVVVRGADVDAASTREGRGEP